MIIVTHEESQAVCIALRELGYVSFSCDIVDCSGGHPEWHIKGDAIATINSRKWNRVISFPPCTDLAVSGAGHFAKKRLSGEQEASINHFLDVWELANAVENPKNIMSGWRYIKKWFPHIVQRMNDINFPIQYTQSIQPYQFGHTETKETWLWLKNLPLLKGTNDVYEATMKLPYKDRAKVHCASPGPERSKLRSRTYKGIAEAMASQWGNQLTEIKAL